MAIAMKTITLGMVIDIIPLRIGMIPLRMIINRSMDIDMILLRIDEIRSHFIAIVRVMTAMGFI